ncbi:Na+/H+ antiporter NhaA, partial [Bacteroides fragilis]|nr:Na+/H+ antiporter NhaA [Bacteroides fragilis]
IACGIGFTVSFLIASLAYANAELSAEARFGVLLGSLVAAAVSAVLLSRQSARFARMDSVEERLAAMERPLEATRTLR